MDNDMSDAWAASGLSSSPDEDEDEETGRTARAHLPLFIVLLPRERRKGVTDGFGPAVRMDMGRWTMKAATLSLES